MAEEEWPFDEEYNLAVITTRQITQERQPILYVTHDEDDGGWQFHDGGTPGMEDAQIVSLHFITKIDPAVKELADLPLGWTAWRTEKGAVWQRAPFPSTKTE